MQKSSQLISTTHNLPIFFCLSISCHICFHVQESREEDEELERWKQERRAAKEKRDKDRLDRAQRRKDAEGKKNKVYISFRFLNLFYSWK